MHELVEAVAALAAPLEGSRLEHHCLAAHAPAHTPAHARARHGRGCGSWGDRRAVRACGRLLEG